MVVSTGPYMMTRTGRRFYFDAPNPASIDLRDIDHALRHLNRFTGHVGPYNVATHSVNVLMCALDLGADDATARLALMHDAHEAYVGDISSPLKIAIGPAFAAVDQRAADVVAIRFKLCGDAALVHKADRMVTHAEALAFLGEPAKVWAVDPWTEFRCSSWGHSFAFLDACQEWGIE
jgi:hypothetical protein